MGIKTTVFRCSYCGKLYASEKGCNAHEEKYCGKSPNNLALCYSCKWLEQTDKYQTITTEGGTNPFTGFPCEAEKEIRINRCHKRNANMFNSFHAKESLREDAENNGFCIMPTVRVGCVDYQKKELT